VPRLAAEPVVHRLRGRGGRRPLAGPQRRDPGRIRGPRPPGAGGDRPREPGPRPRPQPRPRARHRRVRVVRRLRRLALRGLPRRGRRAPSGHRCRRADRRLGQGALGRSGAARLGPQGVRRRARRVLGRGVAARPQRPARRLEQDRPARLPAAPRLRLRVRLVRGRLVHLPGAARRPADQHPAPHLRALPPAAHRCDHPDRRRPALRGLRPLGARARPRRQICLARRRGARPALPPDDLALPAGAPARRPGAAQVARPLLPAHVRDVQAVPPARRLPDARAGRGPPLPGGRARVVRLDAPARLRPAHRAPGQAVRAADRQGGSAGPARRRPTSTTGPSCGCRSTGRSRSTPRTGTAG
jgi:hypothetical protein